MIIKRRLRQFSFKSTFSNTISINSWLPFFLTFLSVIIFCASSFSTMSPVRRQKGYFIVSFSSSVSANLWAWEKRISSNFSNNISSLIYSWPLNQQFKEGNTISGSNWVCTFNLPTMPLLISNALISGLLFVQLIFKLFYFYKKNIAFYMYMLVQSNCLINKHFHIIFVYKSSIYLCWRRNCNLSV